MAIEKELDLLGVRVPNMEDPASEDPRREYTKNPRFYRLPYGPDGEIAF